MLEEARHFDDYLEVISKIKNQGKNKRQVTVTDDCCVRVWNHIQWNSGDSCCGSLIKSRSQQ